MASSQTRRRQTEGDSQRAKGGDGAYAKLHREARLAGELTWPGFEFIDPHNHFEGRLVGFFLDVPFDWSIMSPELIREE